jgi:hypothetical protein
MSFSFTPDKPSLAGYQSFQDMQGFTTAPVRHTIELPLEPRLKIDLVVWTVVGKMGI